MRTLQLAAGDYTFSYDWQCNGETTWDNVHAFLVPTSVTLAAGSAPGLTGSTNTCPSGWIELGGYHSGQSTWQTANGVFSIADAGVYQLAFLWKNDGSGGSNPPASIDNIAIAQLSCPQPTGLTVSNITAYTAEFDWTPVGTETSWEVFARKAGDTITATVSSHPYTFTGLTQHSTYTFGVKALCSADDESFVSTTTAQTLYSCPAPTALSVTNATLNSLTISWTAGGNEQGWYVACAGDTVYTTQNPYTITGLASSTPYSISLWGDCGTVDGQSLVATTTGATSCAVITDYPWTENFDALTAITAGAQPNVLPPCWDRYNGCSGSSYTAFPSAFSGSTYAHSGNNALRFYTMNSTSTTTTYTEQMAILPEMQNLGGKMLSFWMRCNSSSYVQHSYLAIGVYEGGNVADNASYTWLDTIQASNDYQFIEFPLSAYAGQGNRIALKGLKPTTASYSSYCSISVDDITVDELPSCFRPSAVSLTAVSSNSLTISWTAGGAETAWNVAITDDPNADVETLTAQATTTNSYTFTGLNGNTLYYVYVQANCGNGDVSDWTSVSSYRTNCAAETLPWSENFDNVTGFTAALQPCWGFYQGLYAGTTPSSTTSQWTYVAQSSVYPSNHMKINIYGTSRYGWLVTPEIALTENATLSFDVALTDYNNMDPIEDATTVADDRFCVFVSTDGNTWQPLRQWGSDATRDDAEYTSLTNVFSPVSIDLTQYTGQTVRFAFYGESTVSGGDNDLRIDNILVSGANQGGGDTTGTDLTCNWQSNTTGESATSALGGFTSYGIYSYAERIDNPYQQTTIDQIRYMFYDGDSHGGNVTLAIYDEVNGLPGTSLGSVVVNSTDWVSFTQGTATLATPVTVDGAYYIVATVSDDNTNMLATANRTQATSTGYLNYNGWTPIYNVLSNNQTFYCSLFLDAHACYEPSTDTFTVTLAVNDPAMGTVTGAGSYVAYEEATLTATPNAGYYFVMWNDSITVNPRTITVQSDTAFTAIFAVAPSCEYTLPYTCGFETFEEQFCWTAIDGDGDGHGWTLTESTMAHSGSNMMISGSYLNSVGALHPSNWLISPELTIPAEGATLTYWVAPQDQSYPADYYEVVLSNGSTDTLSFTTTLFTETLSAADYGWSQRTIQITTPGTVRFAFHHMNSYDVYIINLDDISVVANEPVATPCDTVSNIYVENVTYNSADLYWSTTADSCHLEVMVGNDWVAIDNWGIPIEQSYFFYGLDPETTYQVRIRAICDSVTYSDWSMFSFTTDTFAIPDCIDPVIDSIVPGSYSAQMYWSLDNDDPWSSCEMQYIVNGGQFDDNDWPIDVRDSPYTIQGLTPETTYQVRIRAFCYYDEINEEAVYTNWVYATFTTTAADPSEGIFIPHTGSQTLSGNDACGLDITVLTDDEGLYLDNANGILTLVPADGDTLTLTGTYDIEEDWDFLIITANGQTDSLTGEGTVNIVTTGTIVLHFLTDGSTWGDYAGVDLHTTCSGSVVEPTIYTVTLLVNDEEMGTVSGAGQYEEGTEVEIAATANEGYHFVSWSDDNTNATRTLTVTEDITLTANFAINGTEPEMYTITVMGALVRQGEFTDTLYFIAEEANMVGGGEYADGAEATISVTPLGEYAGATFLGWQDGNIEMPRTITVTEDAIFTAFFRGTEGIDGVELTAIRLYPNPASEQVTVEGYEGRIQVLDMSGRVVLSSDTHVLDIRSLASGAYFVKAGQQVKKLIVK